MDWQAALTCGVFVFKKMLELSKRKINCPTFLSKEGTIGALYRYIFETKSFQDKVLRTYQLLDETENLLNCHQFDGNRDQCRMCRRICRFRKQTANQTFTS